MADLTYDDVRRASQDALREIHTIVNNIRTNSEDMKRSVQSHDTQQHLSELTNRLTNLENQITILDTNIRNQQNTIHLLHDVQAHIADLHRRLGTTEDFIKYVHDYFMAQAREQAERE